MVFYNFGIVIGMLLFSIPFTMAILGSLREDLFDLLLPGTHLLLIFLFALIPIQTTNIFKCIIFHGRSVTKLLFILCSMTYGKLAQQKNTALINCKICILFLLKKCMGYLRILSDNMGRVICDESIINTPLQC